MNVKELIAKLQECPPEGRVAIGAFEADGRVETMEIAGETPVVVIHATLLHESPVWGEAASEAVREWLGTPQEGELDGQVFRMKAEPPSPPWGADA